MPPRYNRAYLSWVADKKSVSTSNCDKKQATAGLAKPTYDYPVNL